MNVHNHLTTERQAGEARTRLLIVTLVHAAAVTALALTQGHVSGTNHVILVSRELGQQGAFSSSGEVPIRGTELTFQAHCLGLGLGVVHEADKTKSCGAGHEDGRSRHGRFGEDLQGGGAHRDSLKVDKMVKETEEKSTRNTIRLQIL
jgi:hypothetical protein